MTLETFFEKFDLIADAPNAVAKMRELVLDLAVKGKLTDRDLKKESVGSRYFDEPSADVLPANWRLLNFGKFCDIQGGNQPPKSQFSDEPRPGYVQMFQIRDLGERPVPVYISKESTNRFCREGEILIGRYGASVGKVFWAQDGAYNVALAKFIFPEDALLPAFAFWVLKSDFFQAEIAGASRSAQAGFNKGDLAAIDFPLPPLAEQKRIVAKVDELMALCDRLEAQQQEREEQASKLARASLARFADAPTPANLPFLFHPSYAIPPADLRKSILTLAVQGKLVPQDPNDEPADELFERIQAERAEQEAKGAYKSSRPLEPIEEAEQPFKLPVEWKWARLRSLVFTLGDGLHGTPEYSDGTDCYFINGNNLVDGRIVIKPHTKTVSLDEAKKHRKPMTLSTVLVSINGTLGSVAFYNNENVILGKSACYFNLSSLVDKHFARRVIESPYFVNYASENATGTTIRNLGLKAMNYFPFPLPPLAEQRRIVAKVEQLMALVYALETQLAASRATAANLLSALVAELTAG